MTTLPSHPELLSGSKIKISNIKMKKINDTITAYDKGVISKPDFIKEMHEMHHTKLFEYARHLPKTNIKKIEIQDDQIIMTSRDLGVRMLCNSKDHRLSPIEVLNFLEYEKNDSKMIDNLVDNGAIFFDIGANLGWYSINIGLSHHNVQIHCFEPIPQTYAFLQQNLKLNAVPNFVANNFGFSNFSGELDFYFYEEGMGNASSANLSNRDDVHTLKCKVQTLDEYISLKNTSVDFIKCDVEGAELLVFQGGIQTIARYKPIVFSEILRKWSSKFNYNPNQIFDYFKSQNYRAFITNGEKLKEFFVMDESTIETNFFFLHNEKHSKQIQHWLI